MLLRNAGPHGNKDASLETMKSIHYTGVGTRRMHSAGTLHTLQRGALTLEPMEEASSHSKNGARPMGGGEGAWTAGERGRHGHYPPRHK